MFFGAKGPTQLSLASRQVTSEPAWERDLAEYWELPKVPRLTQWMGCGAQST